MLAHIFWPIIYFFLQILIHLCAANRVASQESARVPSSIFTTRRKAEPANLSFSEAVRQAQAITSFQTSSFASVPALIGPQLIIFFSIKFYLLFILHNSANIWKYCIYLHFSKLTASTRVNCGLENLRKYGIRIAKLYLRRVWFSTKLRNWRAQENLLVRKKRRL